MAQAFTAVHRDIFTEAFKLARDWWPKRPLGRAEWDAVNDAMMALMVKAKSDGCERLAAELLVGVHDWLELGETSGQ